MYTEKAIERLNNINWDNIGKNGQKKDMELGIEFIRKMAVFCEENNITPNFPFMTNLSSFFVSCTIGDEILNKCNSDVRKIIYEPIIRLFENGGDFVYRERGMSFINSGLIPLTNWFENFKN